MGLFHKSSKQKERLISNEDYEEEVRGLCETIDNANLQINIIRKEYDEVNRYLQDAQLIDSMPEEAKAELVENARHILSLKKDMAELSLKKTNLTEFEFGIMERYESVLPAEIKRLKREEEYEAAIKSDLKKLSGEKAVLRYEEETENGRRKFLSKMGGISGAVIGLLLTMYLILYIVFRTFASVPFLLTVAGGVFMAFYIFIETDKNAKALKLNAAKFNRLIAITNKVKVKYVNQKASIDFSFDKYAVNSVMELEYRYNQYMAFKDDEMKRLKTSSVYEHYNSKYKSILDEYKIHDSEVWSYQAGAVVDSKEMVEIRHKLNERRQKMRDSLEKNMNIITEAGVRLTEIGEKSAELSIMVNGMMEFYGIGV